MTTTTAAVQVHQPQLLLWSAHDDREEHAVRARLLADLRDGLPVTVPRGSGPVRGAVVTTPDRAVGDVFDAATHRVRPAGPRPVAVLFPGQGSQYPAMAAQLYATEAVFRAAVDEVLDLWGEGAEAIRADWLLPDGHRPVLGIDEVGRAQPMLFAVDHALGRLLLSWGVQPSAVLGHSAGEVVAATIAGVFDVAEAVAIVRDRVSAALPIPAGGMLAVAGGAAELRPYLVGDVAIAAVNAGRQTMLAGPDAELALVAGRLEADGYTLRRVPATTPFHCPAMEPAVVAAQRTFRARPKAPDFAVWSGYTARLLTPELAASGGFWAWQLAATVHFGPALTNLLAGGEHVLVEAGPGQTLSAFARRQKAVRTGASSVLAPMLPGPDAGEQDSVLATAAALWIEGHDISAGAPAGLRAGGPRSYRPATGTGVTP